jgi:chromosome segregation ATPase
MFLFTRQQRVRLTILLFVGSLLITACGAEEQAKQGPNSNDDSASDQVSRLQKALDERGKRLDELTRELEAKSKQLDAFRREAEAIERQLRQDCATLKKARDELGEQLKQTKAATDAAIAGLKSVEDLQRKQVATLEGQIQTLKKERDELFTKAISATDSAAEATQHWAATEKVAAQFGKTLLKSLKATEASVRRWGAESLGSLGADAEFALMALERAKDDEEAAVSAAVTSAIFKIRAAVARQADKDRKN